MMANKTAMTILALALGVSAVTGCGRRGSLETPSRATSNATAADQETSQSASTKKTDEEPDRPFLLDGLIE